MEKIIDYGKANRKDGTGYASGQCTPITIVRGDMDITTAVFFDVSNIFGEAFSFRLVNGYVTSSGNSTTFTRQSKDSHTHIEMVNVL